ncbi:MAG: hypothetical protein ACXACA_01100 [Candidatus Ranarchaeia archaeon]|jgi:hypothetical protein
MSWDLIIWLPTFILSGTLLKLLDSASDQVDLQKQSKKSFWFLGYLGAVSCAILFLWISSVSYHFAALYIGITLGVLFAGKVDSPFFLLGTVIYVVGIFFVGLDLALFPIGIAILVLIFSAIDELGHNLLEANPGSRINTPILVFIFKYRFLLKVGVLLLFLIGLLDGIAAIGLWLFDFAYILTDYLLVTR